ncbi:MAG: aminotransferase class III-fold pyridoxal phosphate-dependent enzyme, partial [Anaerolineales bacterium]
EKWQPGSHGGTFGGNALAAAAGVATIQTITEENLLSNAAERGLQLIGELREIQRAKTVVGDVRGLGLMVGVEFRTFDGKPDKKTAKQVVHNCLERKLMLLTCGPWDNTIRFIPPLVVNQDQIAQALEIFRDSLP